MNSTISEYIKTSRLELGLTQDELAQRAGISVRYLCDIENDHGIPSDWVYESLQQALSNHEQNRMKWSAQLRKTRRTYGVKQEWFALQLGMTTKQLRALETGKTELPYCLSCSTICESDSRQQTHDMCLKKFCGLT